METKLGDDCEDVVKLLHDKGIGKKVGAEALESTEENCAFAVFSVMDALTQMVGKLQNAGDRTALAV